MGDTGETHEGNEVKKGEGNANAGKVFRLNISKKNM